MTADKSTQHIPLITKLSGRSQRKAKKKGAHVVFMDAADSSLENARNKRVNYRRQDSVRDRYDKVDGVTTVHQYSDELLTAVEEGDYDKCEKLLDNKDVNVKDKETQRTALHIAAKKGYDVILCLLLDKGADCNAQDNTEQTPLHLAATKDYFECCVQLLADPHLQVNAVNKTHDTALHHAAKEGRYDICDKILDHPEANVNAKNKKGMTPLHLAAQENHSSVLQLLMGRGADLKVKDNQFYLALHYAAQKGFPESCEELMSLDSNANKQKQLKATIRDGKTPIILAAKGGHHKCCEKLGGTNINAKDTSGNTALFYAASGGFENTISALLDIGADPNTQNNDRIAPIHEASKKKKPGSLQILIEKRVNWDVKDKHNKTVLHYAAEKNSTECLNLLLTISDVKGLLDEKDKQNHTPLHLAIKRDGVECAGILLDNGASATEQCVGGMTPLHLAADKGYTGICEKLLARKEVRVSQENDVKATPLHLAALHGSTDVCQMLIRKGARLTAADINGRTALHVASVKGHANVAKFLIRRGISQRAKDDTGSTALHLAACEGALECCKVLAAGAKGASWEMDNNKDLPLDRAFNKDHDEVFKFLLLQLSVKEHQEGRMMRLHDYIHKALDTNRIIAAEAIIDSAWWKAGLIGHSSYQCQNFRRLVKEHPCLALKVQDKCILQPTNIQDSSITYDFGFLEDNYYVSTAFPDPNKPAENPYDETGKLKPKTCKFTEDGLTWKKNHPLTLMIACVRPQLLQHPLVNAWLIQKWRAYMVKLFLVLLVLEIIFSCCLLAFMAKIENWNDVKYKYGLEKDQFCNMELNTSLEINQTNATKPSEDVTDMLQRNNEDSKIQQLIHETLFDSINENVKGKRHVWIALVTVTILVLLLEFNYIIRLRKEYVTASSPLQISRTILIVVILIPFHTCNYHYMVLDVLQWQAGIITLLFSWLLLINTLNQLPMISVFMPITRRFLTSFFKVVFYIVMLVFAFAFIFHLLLRNQPAFSTVSQAMVKTIVWMLGDLAYDDTFLIDDQNLKLFYPVLVNILFVVFVTVIGGFIVNLVITQPSDKLHGLRDRASFHRAASRVELFLKLDVCFPFFLKWTKGTFVDGEKKIIGHKIISYLTQQLLSLNKLETQEDTSEPVIQKVLLGQLEEQNKNILTLTALLAEQKDEIKDLKHQLDAIAKSLPGVKSC